MPQTQLILTDKNSEQIVTSILDTGAMLIPNLHYKEPKYEYITTLNQFTKMRSAANLFFIVREDWIVESLIVREVNHQTEGKIFYIGQKEGGPTINFGYWPERIKDNKRYVGTGFLSYHDKFWSESNNQMMSTPQELKTFYKSLVSKFKRDAISKKSAQTYWINNDANKLIESGELYMPFTI